MIHKPTEAKTDSYHARVDDLAPNHFYAALSLLRPSAFMQNLRRKDYGSQPCYLRLRLLQATSTSNAVQQLQPGNSKRQAKVGLGHHNRFTIAQTYTHLGQDMHEETTLKNKSKLKDNADETG